MDKWIECRDRMPLAVSDSVTFEQVTVIACDIYGNVAAVDFARGGGHVNMPWANWSESPDISIRDIVAWMPMPAPFAS